MMYHAFSGLGDDNSVGAANLANPTLIDTSVVPVSGSLLATPQGSVTVQWCNANPGQALFTPDCWTNYFSGLNEPSLTQSYLQGYATPLPPTQDQINSQTPDQTINQNLAASQAAAVAAALAAAGQDTVANAPTPSICTQGSSTYNAFLCFLQTNGTALTMLAIGVVALMVIPKR